jgi:mono/diheme cytochrome c family protein
VNTKRFLAGGAGVLALGLLIGPSGALPLGSSPVITAAPQVAAATTTVAGDSAAQRKVLDQFCSGCHGQRA